MAVIRILNDMAVQFETAVIVVAHEEKIIPSFRRLYRIRDGRTKEESGKGRALNEWEKTIRSRLFTDSCNPRRVSREWYRCPIQSVLTMCLIRSYMSVGVVLFRVAIFFRVNSSEASTPCFFNSRTTNFIFRLN